MNIFNAVHMGFLKKNDPASSESISLEAFRHRFSLPDFGEEHYEWEFPFSLKGYDNQKQIDVSIKIIPRNSRYRSETDPSIQKKIVELSHAHLMAPYASFSVLLPDNSDRKSVDQGQNQADPEKGFTALVFQFAEKGNLNDFLVREYPLKEKARAVNGILKGLGVLHKHGMIHGFLKPANILVQDVGHPHVRLVDYGMMPQAPFTDLNVNLPQGAILYMAPELIDADQTTSTRKPGAELDFWSFGVILFEMIVGVYPFGKKTDSNTQLASRICLMDLKPVMALVPEEFKLVISACLQRNPNSRVKSVQELQKLLPETFGGPGQKHKKTKSKSQVSGNKETWTKRLFASKQKEKIRCSHCGNLNESGKAVCKHCKNPLRGPQSLRQFTDPTTIGVWVVVVFSLLLVPIFISYWEIYQECGFETGSCNLVELLQMDQPDEPISDSEKFQLGLLATFFIVGYLLYTGLFTWWLVVTNENLKAFGSLKSNASPFYPVFGLLILLVFIPGFLGISEKKFFMALAVGSVFYIGASLYTLQQIWKGSDPVYLLTGEQWKKSRVSFLIFSRWALSFLFPLILIMPLMPNSPGAKVSEVWFLFWVGLSVVYWIISILVITRINYRQNTKFRALTKA